MQRILSGFRKAIENYNMIEEGDKIAIGLSGGKDSITLVMALKALQRFYPKKFDIITREFDKKIKHFQCLYRFCQIFLFSLACHCVLWYNLHRIHKGD